MSQKTRAVRNRKAARPPVKADPHKQKATLAQFATLAQEAQQAHQQLVQKANRAINELWKNQQEILQGLSAAEFNLRAHQKVMNAIALELNSLGKRMPMPVGMSVDATPSFLVMKELPGEGQAWRIDWPHYHKQVEEELKAMREAEKAAKEAAEKEAAAAAEKAKDETPKEAPAPEAPSAPESGTVGAKEDGGSEVPDGATVFG